MKRSDKLLLTFFLSTIGIVGAVHLGLYARYKAGNIVNRGGNDQLIMAGGDVPATLSLNGDLNVRIISSDSFAVKWSRRDEAKVKYRRSGDSLIISADSQVFRDPHSQWQQYDNFPWVFIYCGGLKKLQMTGALALMKGGLSSAHLRLGLEISNTQLLLGKPEDPQFQQRETSIQPDLGREFYDSLDIRATNSRLVLDGNVVIHTLHATLDDRSELHELKATIESPDIHYGPHSRITLNGATLDKLK